MRPPLLLDDNQIALLMRSTSLSVVLGSFYAVMVAAPFIGLVPTPWLAGWVLVFIAIRGARLWMVAHWRRSPAASRGAPRWSVGLFTAAVVQSLVWGLGSWILMAPELLVAEAALHIGLAVVVLSNVLHLSNVYPVLVIYTLGVLAPLVLRDLWVGQLHTVLAGMSALLVAYVLLLGRRHARISGETQAQRRRNAELINELQQEVQARAQAQAQAEQAHADKAHFLAAAGHDLRQPLNAIGLLAQALPHKPDPTQVNETADRIYECVEQMGDIVDGLMQLSRLDAGTVVPEPSSFPLAPLLDELVALHQPQAADKGLRLSASAPPATVHTDARLLQRVLSNLVANAIQHTPHGEVRLQAHLEGEALALQVVDTGSGIAAHELPRIFEPFYQVGNAARDGRQGHGLGLAIVKRLSALLGLQVQVHSQPGQGSCFTLRVPLAGAATPTATPAVAARAEAQGADVLHGRQVLVIEDDAASCDAMQRLLAGWGCQVRHASNTDEALAQLHGAWRPEFVVADLRLAGGDDGCHTTQRLREVLGGHLPAVLVTGEAGSARAASAEQAGFRVLRKPVRPVQLRAFMNDAFAAR